MIIQESIYNVFFPKIMDLRRKFFDVEEKLCKHYVKPFTLNAIPDNLLDEIPRIQAISKSGHTNFSMSLNNAQFRTVYDKNFNTDWNKCKDYILKHITELLSVLSEITNDTLLFNGLSVNIYLDEYKDDPIELIKNKLIKLKSNKVPIDINLRTAFVFEENYYVNLEIQNLKEYQGNATSQNPSLLELEQVSHALLLSLDINDRYAFNNKVNYHSGIEKANNLLDLVDHIIKENLNSIIEKGEFNL